MGRLLKIAGGLCMFTLVLASCNPFDQGEQTDEPAVAESAATAVQQQTATATVMPPTATPTNPPATATATEVPPAATPTQVPPTPTVVANWVVGNTRGDGVFIRETPDMDDKIKPWPDGTEMVVVGPDVNAEDRLWKNVRDPDGNAGFIPADYLLAPESPETPPTPSETPAADPDDPTPAPETPELAYVVANTDGDGVFIRRTLDDADRIKAWPDGTEMVVVGPDVTEDDVVWKNIRDPDGNEGFVPAEFLILSEAETTEASAPAATGAAEDSTGTAAPDAPSRPPKDDSY